MMKKDISRAKIEEVSNKKRKRREIDVTKGKTVEEYKKSVDLKLEEKSDNEYKSSDDDEIAEIGRQNEDEEKRRKKMKKRREGDDGSELFSKAMNALLDTHLKAHDRVDPIFSRSKGQIKKFEDEKLEQKAKKLLLAKKRAKMNASRRMNLISDAVEGETAQVTLQREKSLKKVARRGVVKLFNAIMAAQAPADNAVSRSKGRYFSEKREQEDITDVSKEKFLGMVQAAAQRKV
ncbi:hypothetical protein HII13_001970 [Brettanomyces bruxellensis]|nr:hypothetical protein HII13_001970 [Brettanomyces bruxellensis]